MEFFNGILLHATDRLIYVPPPVQGIEMPYQAWTFQVTQLQSEPNLHFLALNH
jgi:hypothetical protein